ncbi:MAG: flagellar motor switch protein FliM, partial [Planctomycetota bacterium]
LHDSFARSFGASLSGYLRTIVEVRVSHSEQITYSQFTQGLPNPTSFNLIEASPLDGQMCLELSPLVTYPIIDRLLGGNNQDLFIPQREMTPIEQRLIQTVMDRAMTSMNEAWEGVATLDFQISAMESNPQIVQIVPPNEVVIVIGFEIKLGNRAGTMGLCIPYNVIEPLITDLSAQSWALMSRDSDDHTWDSAIANHLNDARVEMTGVLAETSITMNELARLEVGDVIMTGRPSTAPAIISVAGKAKHIASLGQYRGNRALRVIRPVRPADRLD